MMTPMITMTVLSQQESNRKREHSRIEWLKRKLRKSKSEQSER